MFFNKDGLESNYKNILQSLNSQTSQLARDTTQAACQDLGDLITQTLNQFGKRISVQDKLQAELLIHLFKAVTIDKENQVRASQELFSYCDRNMEAISLNISVKYYSRNGLLRHQKIIPIQEAQTYATSQKMIPN